MYGNGVLKRSLNVVAFCCCPLQVPWELPKNFLDWQKRNSRGNDWSIHCSNQSSSGGCLFAKLHLTTESHWWVCVANIFLDKLGRCIFLHLLLILKFLIGSIVLLGDGYVMHSFVHHIKGLVSTSFPRRAPGTLIFSKVVSKRIPVCSQGSCECASQILLYCMQRWIYSFVSYTTKNCSLSRGETIQQVGSTEQDKYSLIARTARTLDVCGKILWLEFREAAETINKTIFHKQLLKVLQGCLKKKSSAQIEEVAMCSCLGEGGI